MPNNENNKTKEDSVKKRGLIRIRKVAITGFVTLMTRSITIIANLISIPLTASYLGAERFGVWLFISTLLSWAMIADLGLANSLTNLVATADGKNDVKQVKEAVSNVFLLMIAIAFILSIIFTIAYPWINWVKVFNVSSIPVGSEAGIAALVSSLFFVLRLPLSITGRIYIAYQEGYFYQLWAGFNNLLSLGALLVSIHLKLNLPLLILAFFGSSLLADVFCTIHLFTWHRPAIKPDLRSFNPSKSWKLLTNGIQFWIIQVSAIAFLQTDLIIITQLFGATAAASYGVVLKLFTMITLMQAAFLNPLWPAYSEALSRKDINWIINTFKRSLKVSIIWSLLSGMILFYASPKILLLWLGKDAIIDNHLFLAMLLSSILLSIAQPIATLLNALNLVNSQIIFGSMAGITNIILSFILGKQIGMSGVTWATVICLFTFSIVLISIELNQTIRKIKNNCDESSI
jgi:O-antigen/teichoic acid export membrane protein